MPAVVRWLGAGMTAEWVGIPELVPVLPLHPSTRVLELSLLSAGTLDPLECNDQVRVSMAAILSKETANLLKSRDAKLQT